MGIPKRPEKIAISRFPFTPSTYPGSRPRFSFFFTSEGIYRVSFRTLDLLLRSRNLPSIADRYAVLAYGSNACPGQLLLKKLNDVPVLFGRVSGVEAVYANRETRKGYVPATLARKQGSAPSWVTLLTVDQLKTMDSSEGRPNVYALAQLPRARFFMGKSEISPLYTYVDTRGGVMTLNGKPVSLRSMRQKRAKSMLPTAVGEAATRWLDFEAIPSSDAPAKFSKVLGAPKQKRKAP